MILRKLAVFFFIVLAGIGGGVYLIEYAGQIYRLERGIIDFVLVAYVGLFLIISLLLGRSVSREPGDASPGDGDKVKKTGPRVYAWLNPASAGAKAGYPITKKLMTIGREVQVDILINDPTVSKKHAQILYLPGGFLLKDLESSNGTFVNNQRIEEFYLSDKDLVTFGEANYVFTCTKAAEPSREAEPATVELDVDLGELGTGVATATFQATGTQTRGTGTLRSGSQISNMPFKAPKGFEEGGEDPGDTTAAGPGP
jgi:hypothetical protein